MSHFKQYECKVDHEAYIKQAILEMGLQYEEHTTIVDWAKQKQSVAIAIVKDGRTLPLGFQKVGKEFKLVADWFLTPFSEKAFTDKMAQLHEKYRVIDVCKDNAWHVEPEHITTNEQGEIEIIASKWS